MTLPRWLDNLLEKPPLAQIRRNHGLEHATIHLLAQRYPGRFLAGHSDAAGFWLWGQVPQEAVEQAVHEALERLQRGETYLAIHPGCGTNYLAMGTLGGLAAMVTLGSTERSRRSWLDRLPLVILAVMAALLAAQPLGRWLQAYITTSGDARGLEVVAVQRLERGGRPVYRVQTRYHPTNPSSAFLK